MLQRFVCVCVTWSHENNRLRDLTLVLPVRLWQTLLAQHPPRRESRRHSSFALLVDLFSLRSFVPHLPLRRLRVELLCDTAGLGVATEAAVSLQRLWGGSGRTQFWHALSVGVNSVVH